MLITDKTLMFLGENRLNDSRDWFEEHKTEYKELVEAPLLALAEQVCEKIEHIDPAMSLTPRKTMSRIWRDVRFSRDKTTFREEMWLVFRRGKGMEYPAFFFELSPVQWRYGVGYYSAPTKVMASIRELVLAGDRRYITAQKALDKLNGFAIEGDTFKRPHYPQRSAAEREWLERRGFAVIRNESEPGVLFTDKLAGTLIRAFEDLAPIYSFLVDVHSEFAAEDI